MLTANASSRAMRPASASSRLKKALPALAGCVVALAGTMAAAQAPREVPMQTTLHNPTGRTFIIRLGARMEGDTSIKCVVRPSEEVKDAPGPLEVLGCGDRFYDYLAFKAILPPRHRAVFTGDRGTKTLHEFKVHFTVEEMQGSDTDVPNAVMGGFFYRSKAPWDSTIPATVKLMASYWSPKIPFTFESVPSLMAGKNTTEGMLRVGASAPAVEEESKNPGGAPARAAAAAAAAAPLSAAAAAVPLPCTPEALADVPAA